MNPSFGSTSTSRVSLWEKTTKMFLCGRHFQICCLQKQLGQDNYVRNLCSPLVFQSVHSSFLPLAINMKLASCHNAVGDGPPYQVVFKYPGKKGEENDGGLEILTKTFDTPLLRGPAGTTFQAQTRDNNNSLFTSPSHRRGRNCDLDPKITHGRRSGCCNV